MSDFHLQQLAAASASVPDNGEGGAVVPVPQASVPLAGVTVDPTGTIPNQQHHPMMEGAIVPPPPAAVPPVMMADPVMAPGVAPPAAAMLPPPQHQQHHHQPSTHNNAAIMPPPAHQQQPPHHAIMAPHNMASPAVGLVDGSMNHHQQQQQHHHHPLPPMDPMELERRYHEKCNECEQLKHALEMKTLEARKLAEQLAGRGVSNKNNNNSNKAGGPIVIPEKLMIDVDIGPSSSRTRSYDQRWKARFQDLVKYKLLHGDCIVPKSYKDKSLHSWVRKQRILKKDFDLGLASEESMTQERVDALNSIGFSWHVGHQSNDVQWESNFQDLLVFKTTYGHTRVPASYEKSLHKWVLNQRCRRRLLEERGEGKAKGMTWPRVEKLEAIDFAWSGKK